ncbi:MULTISPECIES: AAA family ATPase [Bacillus cereus group]|uniref:AAA family ATPase n=1 Tax=Bacillus cereus TaxID=1396 RepID=UPI00387F2A00
MNLKRLKLLSDYKIFKRNLEFNFNDSKIFAVVGANGSGKSIFQEVIANVFVNLYAKLNKYQIFFDLDYEIEYSLEPNSLIYSVVSNKQDILKFEDLKEIIVKARSTGKGKDCFEFDVFYRGNCNNIIQLEVDNAKLNLFLPNSLVVYSSGENETISNELLRYRLINLNKYYDRMNEIDSSDGNMKLHYVHDNYRSLLILSLLIFKNEKIEKLKDLVRVDGLHSMLISINFKQRGFKRIELPEKESFDLNKLLRLSNNTSFDQGDNLDGLYEFYFKEQYEIFKDEYIDDPVNLYRVLENFENLNLLKISKRKRKQIEREANYSIKDIHSFYSNENKVFEVMDSKIVKSDNSLVNLLGLSDGEYQVLLIMSLLLIQGNKHQNNLFILDEPDTHFNPEWKAKFVSLLSMMKEDTSQCLFSTHNPEVLTDMRKEDIIFLKEGRINSVDINTFGANPNIIASHIFNKRNTISEVSQKEYENYLDLIDKNESMEDLSRIEEEIMLKFGNSSERMMLLNKIYKSKGTK